MSVRIKLTITFLAIASIPLLFVSALTYTNYKHSLETGHLSSLRDITALKADKIETHFAGLKSNIETAQGFYNIKKNLPVLTRLANKPADPEFLSAKKMLDGQIRQMQSVLGLFDIMLVNPEGKVVYSSNPNHQGKDFLNPLVDPPQKAFEEGKTRVYLSDIFLDKAESNRFAILVTAPAFGFNNAFIGVIAFEVDMAPVYKIVQDMTGLGTTGESVVARKTGNQVLYLSPLLFAPGAALTKTIPLGANVAVPIQNAVQGKTGSGLSVDYQGHDVIGAWRYMPSLGWGLATRIDTQEAFADVTHLRNWSMVILVIVLALSGVTAISIARSISEPINKLSKGASIIGSGNLDYQIGTNLNDEIGELSRTFDKMARDLKHTTASRDELNREIIERKHAEEEVLRQREWLSVTLKSIGDAVIACDTEGRVTFLNPIAAALTGWPLDDALSQPVQSVFRIINEKTREPGADIVGCVLRERRIVALANHTALINKSGREIPIEDSAAPILDAGGAVAGVVLVFHDVTQRRRALEALRESEERLRRFYESGLLGVIYWNINGEIKDANDKFLEMVGHTRDELAAGRLDWACLTPPEYRQRDEESMAELKATGVNRAPFEKEYIRKDGTRIPVLVAGAMLDEARLNGVAYVLDITERKRAEEERETTIDFLNFVNESTGTRDLIRNATTFFQRKSGCEAVGVRLKEGDDYPYYESRGFPEKFVLTENHLCARDEIGNVRRDSVGYPIMECMCGNVIQGRFDPSQPFFTSHGSFWSNCTTELLATSSEADRQSRTRNRCNGEGYESVALIPLHLGEDRLGLLQLNDKRKGVFSPETIGLWERLADHLSVALAKFRAEEAMRESDQRNKFLANLLEQAEQPFGVGYADGTLGIINGAFERLTGYSRDELMAMDWAQTLTPPQWKEIERAKLDELRRTGQPVRYEKEYVHKDGTRVPIELLVHLMTDKAGQPLYYYSFITDLTERKRMALRLEKNLQEHQIILDSVPAMIFYKDAENHFVRTNKAFEDAMGLPKEKLESQSLFDIYPRDQAEAYWKDDKEVMASGKAKRGIIEPLPTAGGTRLIQTDKIPYFDESGNVLGVIGFSVDITERKKAEEALRKANEELERRVRERTAELRTTSLYARSLLEAGLDPLVTISPEGKITDVNEATELVTGIGRDRLIGTDFCDYFTAPDQARKGYQKVLAEGLVRDYPLIIRHTSGRTTEVHYNATIYRNESGQVQGVFAAARDVTEIKQIQAELARSNKELEQFAYVASHDLQEPLRMVASYVGLLNQRYGDRLDEKGHQFINFAVDGAQRMQGLISDMLAYSRVGTRGHTFQPVDCQVVLDNVLQNLRIALDEHHVRITHDPLPKVMADETQLYQVFQNLIGNAVKFHGDKPPEIHVSAQLLDGFWQFSFQDNGIGIEPQYFERIFLIFQRLHTRNKYPGTGIGLAVCKRIVERHGGRIWCTSQLGQGTTFYFTLSNQGVEL